MVQRVEAWGNTLEFPDGMSDEDMASAIRKNEVHLNPNASTLTKASAAVSRGLDAGLAMFTPRKSIADQAQEQSASLASTAAPQVPGVPIRRDYYNQTVAETPKGSSVPDTGIVSRVQNIAANDKKAQLGKRTVGNAITSTEPDEGIGLLGTLKEGTKGTARNIGAAIDTVQGNAGNVVSASQDAASAEKDPALESLLNDINARKKALGENPGWLDSIKAVGGAAINNPKGAGLLVAEQLPNSATALGAGAAGMAAGSVFGPAGAVVGGIAGLFGANTALETGGKAIEAAADGTFSPAEQSRVLKEGAIKGGVITGVDAATLGLTNFIMGTTARAVERATAKTLMDNGVDVTNKAAVLAASKNPAIVAAVQSSQQLAKAASDTLGKKIARVGGATGLETVGEGAGEYLGEMAATGKADKVEAAIEALSSSSQSMGEIAFTAARNKAKLATIAGKPVEELSDSVLKYTANRGSERAKAAAQAELDRRATSYSDEQLSAASDHAQTRIREITTKLNGTKDQVIPGPDGKPVTIKGEAQQFVSPDEKAELEFLQANQNDPAKIARAYRLEPKGAENNAEESTSEAVNRIIATGKDKADEIRSTAPDAIQGDVLDEEPDQNANTEPDTAGTQSQPVPSVPAPAPIQTPTTPEKAPETPKTPTPKGPSDKQIAHRAKLKKQARERRMVNSEDTMNQAIIKMGGIHDSLRNDLTGDTKGNQSLPFVGHLFRKSGTQDLSDLATRLGAHGYFTNDELNNVDGGAALLADRLRTEFNGAEPHRSMDADLEAAHNREIDDYNFQLEQQAKDEAESRGVKFDSIAKPEDLQLHGEEPTGKNLVDAELLAKAIAIDPVYVRELAADVDPEGRMTDEFISALEKLVNDSENEVIESHENSHGDLEENEAVKENASEEDIFGLQQQSEKDLKAEAEKKEADKKKKEAEQKKADEEERKTREKKEIEQRGKTSADDFVLGGNAMDELAGQKDIFSQPAQKPEAKPKPEPKQEPKKEPKPKEEKPKAEPKKSLKARHKEALEKLSPKLSRSTPLDVQATVNRITSTWKNSPEIVVVQNMDDPAIPKTVREENERQLSQGAQGTPAGFLYSGKVYLVSSEMKTQSDVARVIFHETLGHFGLRGVFGDDLKQILKQVAALRRADVEKKAKQYGLNMNKESDRLLAAEEVLADLAQTNPQIGFVRRAIAAIRAWLRKNIPSLAEMKMTDEEIIHSYLIPASNFVRNGRTENLDGRIAFQRVFHGTPHVWAPEPGFPHGRPRLDKIGTGEGAQAFGWGWYSAENEGIAKGYREKLIPGKGLGANDIAARVLESVGGDKVRAEKELTRRRDGSENPEFVKRMQDAIDSLQGNLDGALYSLDIPDSVLPRLLDWDKPLDEQPEMHSLLDDAMRLTGDIDLIKWFERLPTDVTGGDVYEELAQLSNGKQTSNVLLKAGIVGNRYLDGGSRADGKGTYNYVIWDQPTLDKIALLERNGAKLDAIREAETAMFARTPGSTFNSPEPSRLDDLVYKLQNKHIDLKRVLESIHDTGAHIADKWNTYLQEELFHGRAAKRTKDFVTQELKPLIAGLKLRGLSIDELDKYLHARHAAEANALIAQRDPKMPDGGSGMTNKESKDYFANLDPEKKRKLEQVAKKVDDILAKTRETYVSYGLIDQATADSWEQMFKHYVPLMREDKDGGMGIGQGFSIKGKEAKHRTGSTRAVVDILANIALQREKAIVRGEKNRVAVSLAGLVKLNPNPGFWTFDKVPTEKVLNEATGLVEERPIPNFKDRDNVITAKIANSKGQIIERAVVFNEDNPRAMRLAQALKNLDATQLEGLIGLSAKITRYFASVNTQYNPVFGVVNLVRDLQGSLVNLSSTQIAGHKAEVMKHVIPAIIGIYRASRAETKGKPKFHSPMADLWDDLQNQGGMTGYRDLFRTSEDRANAIKRELDPTAWMNNGLGKIFTAGGTLKVPLAVAQKGAGWIFDLLSDYNQTLEGAVRLSTYKTAIDNGVNKQQAASIAKNISVNFNRKGQIGQQAGALYAFFNASMQGTARMAETLTSMDKGDIKTLKLNSAGKRIVTGGLVLGAAQALAMAAAGFDDDEPPEFVRERNLIIPIGGKKYVTIPMPLGLHVIPNIGRMTTEFALDGFKDPAKRTMQLMSVFAEAFNPIGNAGFSTQTIMPTPFDPAAALLENKDWTGKPIAKEDFNKLSPTPGFSRNKDTASIPSKWAAEAINTLSGGTKYTPGVMSPTADQIDYLWGQATGGVGREASKLQQTISATATGEDLPPHKIPLVGRFYGSTESQSSQGNKFYSNLKRINELEAEIKGRAKDRVPADEFKAKHPEYRLIEGANYAERSVSNLRRRKSELLKKDAPKEQVKEVENRITEIMTRFNTRYKETVATR